jgi:acetyl/propionyl-CoA carboxylase alpha subunit
VREDRGIEEGGEVTLHYDSLIAKLITWAPDREQALARMERALMEYEIVGVETNIPLCLSVIEHPEFQEGQFTTRFLELHGMPKEPHLSEGVLDAMLAAAAFVYHEERARNGSGNGARGTNRMADQWRAQRFESDNGL